MLHVFPGSVSCAVVNDALARDTNGAGGDASCDHRMATHTSTYTYTCTYMAHIGTVTAYDLVQIYIAHIYIAYIHTYTHMTYNHTHIA